MTLLPDEETTIETYEKVAKMWQAGYNSTGFWAVEMKRFKELLPSGTVLEIGAGGARDAKELMSLGFGYVGTDISKKLLEQAKEDLPEAEFHLMSVYDLSFPQKFDGFWASKVLLHIPKSRIDEALAKIKTVVKPGAIGFISLIAGEGEELRDEEWDDGTRHKRYFAYYSKEEFKKALERNGYEMADYKYWEETSRLRWHCFFVKNVR